MSLATSIPESTCRQLGLGYHDPTTIDVTAWIARAQTDPSLLVVPKAGELLYRLRDDADQSVN